MHREKDRPNTHTHSIDLNSPNPLKPLSAPQCQDLVFEFISASPSGINTTGVSKTSLFIFVVSARFLAFTAKFWQVNDHQNRQELPMNQSKTTLSKSRNLKGLVFLSPDLADRSFSARSFFARPLGLWTSARSGHGCPHPNACFSRFRGPARSF